MADIQYQIPSLHLAKGFITNRSDRAIYLIRHFILNPGGVSDYFEQYSGSMRTSAADYGYDKDLMCANVKTRLTEIMSRNFPGENVQVDVSYFDVDGYKYGLTLDVSVQSSNGTLVPIVLSSSVRITDDYKIELTFNS